MIEFSCPHCGEAMEVPQSLAGAAEQCPACGVSVFVPKGYPEATVLRRTQPGFLLIGCPDCGLEIGVAEAVLGRSVVCEQCGTVYRLPASEPYRAAAQDNVEVATSANQDRQPESTADAAPVAVPVMPRLVAKRGLVSVEDEFKNTIKVLGQCKPPTKVFEREIKDPLWSWMLGWAYDRDKGPPRSAMLCVITHHCTKLAMIEARNLCFLVDGTREVVPLDSIKNQAGNSEWIMQQINLNIPNDLAARLASAETVRGQVDAVEFRLAQQNQCLIGDLLATMGRLPKGCRYPFKSDTSVPEKERRNWVEFIRKAVNEGGSEQ